MNKEYLPAEICTALMRVGTRLATGFDRYFADFSITQAQFRVLIAVYEEGPEGIAPSVLADHLFIERATASVLTTRLIDRGLLARSPGENRRTFRLTLTDAGRTLLASVSPRAVALADTTLAGISPDDLQTIMTMLDIVETRLRAQDLP